MEKIELNTNEFNDLEHINVKDIHTESSLHKIDGKVFKKYENFYEELYNFKLKILNELDNNRELISEYVPEVVLPEELVYIDGKFSGYTMKYINGETLNTILKSNFTYEAKIAYLKKIGEILEKMKKLRDKEKIDFSIHDLHGGNIIVNNSLNIIDIDGCHINGSRSNKGFYLSPECHSPLYRLKEKYNVDFYDIMGNGECDLFSYNMIILNFIFGCEFNKMDEKQYKAILTKFKDLMTRELFESASRLYTEKENINPYESLDKQLKFKKGF